MTVAPGPNLRPVAGPAVPFPMHTSLHRFIPLWSPVLLLSAAAACFAAPAASADPSGSGTRFARLGPDNTGVDMVNTIAGRRLPQRAIRGLQ